VIDVQPAMRRRVFLAGAALALLAGCPKRRETPTDAAVDTRPAAPPVPMSPGFLKGQLHAHSSRSADSRTPPADVRRWYESRGYDFLVFTDHKAVTTTPAPSGSKTLAFPGVELTRNTPSCVPPASGSCALHMNALFVDRPDSSGELIELDPMERPVRRDAYLDELTRAKSFGGIPMVNHPNLRWSGPDEATLTELAGRGLTLLEIRNEAWDSDNAGDATHPSTEALWDGALSRGARLFATATDDAHHYVDAAPLRARGERPFDGDHGFVVVHAERSATSIRTAIAAGDFYASTGLVLDTYALSASAHSIELAARPGERLVFEILGKGGRILRREEGTRLEATLGPDDGPYLRVRMTRATDGAMAWSQPVFRGP
jgi:hypothetical protein